MNTPRAEIWAGAILSALVLLCAVPMAWAPHLVEAPIVVWWAVFAAHALGLLGCMWLAYALPRPVVLASLAACLASGIALVLLAPSASWMSILLIVGAAVSVEILPIAAVWGIVAVNSAALGFAMSTTGAPDLVVVLTTGFSMLIQIVTVLSMRVQVELARSRTRLAVLNTELLTAQALLAESSRSDERLRIARDLHDVIGHRLTGLILELEVASHHATGEAGERVVKARGIARGLMGDVRTAVADQREAGPDLATALRRVADGANGVEVLLSVDDDLPVDGPAFTALLRCAQETVTNALRHSKATRLWIDVTLRDGLLVLTARDDGIGTPELVPGNGLRGMVERTEGMGGSAEFTSPGGIEGGFCVTATVPAP